CADEDPAVARLASDWTVRLAHFSPQDRRQFLAVADRNLRTDRLRSANNRLGRIALGRYDVLAILELAWPAPGSGSQPPTRWMPPQRITLRGGQVEVRTRDIGRQFQVYLGDRLLGFGTVPNGATPLPQPEDWALRLVAAEDNTVLAGPQQKGTAPGPYILVSGELDPSSKPGTI